MSNVISFKHLVAFYSVRKLTYSMDLIFLFFRK